MTLIERRIFLGLVILTTAAFLWMVRGFLVPVFWAAIFAILFQPVYERVLHRLNGRSNTAAAITTLLVVVVVILPAALVFGALAQQALSLYHRVIAGDINFLAPIAWLERQLPVVTEMLARYGIGIEQIRSSIENTAVFATQWIAAQAVAWGQNLLVATIFFALMLYFLFFFLRDGRRIVDGLVRALPMGDDRERLLLAKFAEVSRATIKGTLVVAAVQGSLGGIMFAIVGIDAPVFWGVVMGVLSLLPAVGPTLVWVPAAIILITQGMLWQAAVVILGGTLVIGLIDNILRPILVGRATHMPDYFVLLATLGGLSAFGVAGFVAGPILAALFLVMWEMFATEYGPAPAADTPATAPAAGGNTAGAAMAATATAREDGAP